MRCKLLKKGGKKQKKREGSKQDGTGRQEGRKDWRETMKVKRR